jgi:hypothetical protein
VALWHRGGDYPCFDDLWRIMSEAEWREHLRGAGKIADGLRSLEEV